MTKTKPKFTNIEALNPLSKYYMHMSYPRPFIFPSAPYKRYKSSAAAYA